MNTEKRIDRVRRLFGDDRSLQIYDGRINIYNERYNGRKVEFSERFKHNSGDLACDKVKYIISQLQDPTRKKMIFGAGGGCKAMLNREFPFMRQFMPYECEGFWNGIIDTYVNGERYGMSVISFQTFINNHKDALVYVSLGEQAGKEIESLLRAYGIDYFSYDWCKRVWRKYFEMPEIVKWSVWNDTYLSELENLALKLSDVNCENWIYGADTVESIYVYNNFKAIKSLLLNPKGFTGVIEDADTSECYGLPVISYAEFREQHKNANIFDFGRLASNPTRLSVLEHNGIFYCNLARYYKAHEQYFDLPFELRKQEKDEVFVHAGCYNGYTQKNYASWFGTEYRKMISFEISSELYISCKKNLYDLPRVELVNSGLSDKNGIEYFSYEAEIDMIHSISGELNKGYEVVTLDDYMKGDKVTFIALDIEGSELKALRGMKNTITTYKPKLAISVYHKPEDILEIPELIANFREDYTFYLRNYEIFDCHETILYAF